MHYTRSRQRNYSLTHIASMLSSQLLRAPSSIMQANGLQDSKGRQTFVTAATMAKVVGITAAVYTEHVPSQLRAEMLTPLVSIFGR